MTPQPQPRPPRADLTLRRHPANGAVPAHDYPAEAYGYDPVEEPGPSTLVEYWGLLVRNRRTLLLATFLGGLAALLYSLPQTPVYQTKALVEIQQMNPDFMNMRQVNPVEQTEGNWDASSIETQIEIMQTPSMIERVLKKLSARQPTEQSTDAGRLSAWRNALHLGPAKTSDNWEQALATAAKSLSVRASGRTRIVEIVVDSTNPSLAADFANTLAREFIDQNLESRWSMMEHTEDWLSHQLEDMRIKLERSEARLQEYARRSGLLYTSQDSNVAEERLRQQQQALSSAQADRAAKQSRFELASNSPPDTLPDVLDDTSLREYQTKLTDLRQQEAELNTTYTPEHSKLRRVQAQIAALETALRRERDAIVKRIKNDYDEALRRERLLAADYQAQASLVSDQAEKAIQYNILKREVDSTREIHDAMLQRVKEASVASALRASNVRLVDPARVPETAYKPRVAINVLLGLLLGGMAGIVFVVFRDRADHTLQNPGDISLYLNMRELGIIPAADRKRTLRITYRNGNSRPRLNYRYEPVVDDSEQRRSHRVELVTWENAASMLAESFRSTLTSILLSGQNGSRPRVLTLTSSSPSEGKTTVASNLSIALARLNQRVLLIDADLRRPRLHKIFSLNQAEGLRELLTKRGALDDEILRLALQQTAVENLLVLTSGHNEDSSTATHLLYSQRMADLLQRFKQEFDMVLIDSPPMLQIPDARILSHLSDAAILVLRAGRTTRDTALAARQLLDEDGIRILGSILNCWDPRNGSGPGYGYDYYQRYYRASSSESARSPA